MLELATPTPPFPFLELAVPTYKNFVGFFSENSYFL